MEHPDICKVFVTEEFGQIVVLYTSNPDGLGVDIHFSPPGFGICCMCMQFGSRARRMDPSQLAQIYFESVDKEEALKVVQSAVAEMNERMGAKGQSVH